MDKKAGSDNVVPMTRLPLAPEARFADFYVPPPSKKKGGESGKVVSFVVSDQTHRDIEVMLMKHGDRFPWQTVSDFMRWAADFALTFAAKCADESKVVASTAQRRTLWDSLMMQKSHFDFVRQLDKIQTAVDEMLENGHTQPVVENLVRIKRRIREDMAGDAYWQKVYRDEFDRRFEKHLKKVSLTKFSEDEA